MTMIKSFGSRAQKRYWEKGDNARINPEHFAKVKRILRALDVARNPGDMNIPGFKFHPVGKEFSVWVTGNWRITFGFEDGDATDVDYLDYH